MPEARLQRTRALYDARPDSGLLTDAELAAVFHERYVKPALESIVAARSVRLALEAFERGASLDEQ